MEKNIDTHAVVWDLPVRVTHWLLVVCFAGAYLTSQEESASLVHVTFGYTLVGLMIFRVLWGFVGSRYARFTAFIKGPTAVINYLESLASKEPEHHIGHNPAGALAIVALLALGIAVGFSGFSALHEFGGEWGEEIHESLANLMLVLVLVHVGAVIASSLIHRESLVKSMLTGLKRASTERGIKKTHAGIAIVLIALVSVFWSYQYLHSASGGVDGKALFSEHEGRGESDSENDDD